MNNDELIKQATQEFQDKLNNLTYIDPTSEINAEKINVINLSSMVDIIPAPLEHVLWPILPVQGIGFIYAATGVGKTFFALNLAYAIATGDTFLKYKSPVPRKVLYIDGEMSFNQIHARLLQIHKNSNNEFYLENFNLITPDKVYPLHVPKIDMESDQNCYNHIIDKLGVEVIVFDNLSVLSSIDENKSNEWSIIQGWFLSLRAKGKTIIAVHHSGKEKNGYRGTSKMLDCIDVAISLQNLETDEDDNKPLTKKFKIQYQKARHFFGADALPYEVIFEDGKWQYQSLEISLLEKVVENVKAGLSQREIAKELLISQAKVHRLIKSARLSGLLPIK